MNYTYIDGKVSEDENGTIVLVDKRRLEAEYPTYAQKSATLDEKQRFVYGDGEGLALNIPSENPLRLRVIMAELDIIVCEDYERINEILHAVAGSEGDCFLKAFLSAVLALETESLNYYEGEISKIEAKLLRDNTDCIKELIDYRKKIRQKKLFYNEFSSLVEELGEEYVALGTDITDLQDEVLNLRDFLSQVREAYQAQVDISLNSVMKYLTSVTTIFMPLSLIAGWYGMNLKMPEVDMKYGYFIPIVLALITVVFSLITFKKKKWF